MRYKLSKADKKVFGEITLNGSKSISNRVLIIKALSGNDFNISNLSNSRDTVLLENLLRSDSNYLDAEAAGTTFRFLTAFQAIKDGSVTLTGSDRMKERPVGILVEALNYLGADIEYLEKEGYPPLRLNSPKNLGEINRLRISAGTSSQYISALLLIAPCLMQGLYLELDGEPVSKPYIEMTLQLMASFGIKYSWKDPVLHVPPQEYQTRDFDVEADWSAASYYYSIAAISEQCEIKLNGLFENSLQGDAILPKMMAGFGVETTFQNNSITLRKSKHSAAPAFEWDFLPSPDLAQTLAVTCAALGIHGLFTGLQTLHIKETDRISALNHELAKVNVALARLPSKFSQKPQAEFFLLEGKAALPDQVIFKTYDDHRMAMSFAPLSMLGKIEIENPEVVQKSYPAFWNDLKLLGFDIQEA